MAFVYILQSETSGRFYVGSSTTYLPALQTISAGRLFRLVGEVHGGWSIRNNMLLARKLFDVSARSKVGSPTDRIENLGKFVEYLHAAVVDIAAAK